MKKESNKQEKKNVTYGSIRVKESTKKNITKVNNFSTPLKKVQGCINHK